MKRALLGFLVATAIPHHSLNNYGIQPNRIDTYVQGDSVSGKLQFRINLLGKKITQTVSTMQGKFTITPAGDSLHAILDGETIPNIRGWYIFDGSITPPLPADSSERDITVRFDTKVQATDSGYAFHTEVKGNNVHGVYLGRNLGLTIIDTKGIEYKVQGIIKDRPKP